jgi:hypothetical protein
VTLEIKKLDEEKSKHAGLAQQNGFGPQFLHILGRLVISHLVHLPEKSVMNIIWGPLPLG